MLIGGADLDPASYGAERDPATESTYPERDEFELAMVRAAIERDVPALAICRGMQILNVAFGGTLEQNLVAVDGITPHRKVIGTFDGNEHTVTLEPRARSRPERSASRSTSPAATTTRPCSSSATASSSPAARTRTA